MSTVTDRSPDGRPGSAYTPPTRRGMDSVERGRHKAASHCLAKVHLHIPNRIIKYRGDGGSRILVQNLLKHSASARKEEHGPFPEAATS